jgi:hypothetical protein
MQTRQKKSINKKERPMSNITIEVQTDELHKKVYTFYYDDNTGKTRLVQYQECERETHRKRNYDVTGWYDWYNQRDRFKNTFIPRNEIKVPVDVEQQVIDQITNRIQFIDVE